MTHSTQSRNFSRFSLGLPLRPQSQASDALGPPHEEGQLNSALFELSSLMSGLAEDLIAESPEHRHALLRNALPKMMGAMLCRTYEGEPDRVFVSVQETLRGVARSIAKVGSFRTVITCMM